MFGQTLQDFASLTSQLGLDVADINGSIDAVSAAVSGQAALSSELSSAAEEVATGNRQVETAATQARDATKTARDEATGSRDTVNESLTQLTELVDWVGSTGDQLASIAEALRSISSATGQIGKIAEQTHILALNARIEASRSGSAGQGFQVIADSVRDLANETIAAAKQIDEKIRPLMASVDDITEHGEQARGRAEAMRTNNESISAMIETVVTELGSADEQVGQIAASTSAISSHVEGFIGSLGDLAAGISTSSDELNTAREHSSAMLDLSEKLVAVSNRTGVRTSDTVVINAALDAAARVGATFEAAVDRGEITLAELFDHDYRPIPGSDPQQVSTKFAQFTDRALPAIQEPIVDIDDRITFGICCDVNGYIPTHMKKSSKPQGDDPVWNAANSRNRRIFNDRTGLNCGQNTEPYLVQTYRRDMGGGRFVMMKDTSAPIYVKGRHWGGFRIGYTAS